MKSGATGPKAAGLHGDDTAPAGDATRSPETTPPGLGSPEAASGPPSPSCIARALLALFRVYQLARANRVSPCRFTPTCSQYAIEAVARHGAGRGVRLALRRLGRCRPGGPSGYDPIPGMRIMR